jgi:hypothetical protein
VPTPIFSVLPIRTATVPARHGVEEELFWGDAAMSEFFVWVRAGSSGRRRPPRTTSSGLSTTATYRLPELGPGPATQPAERLVPVQHERFR